MKIGDTVYTFNINYRVYQRDENGRSFGNPIYEEHFRPRAITDEDDKYFICDNGVINKKSKMYRVHKDWGDRAKVYTEKEREDMIWLNVNRYKIVQIIDRMKDVSILKQIADIVGLKDNQEGK